MSRSKQIPVECNKRTGEESRKERCITFGTSIEIKNVFFVLKKVVIRDMQSARWYSLALASIFYKYIDIERAGLYEYERRITRRTNLDQGYVDAVKNL